MPAQWWVFSFGIDTTRSALQHGRRQRHPAHAAEVACQLAPLDIVGVEIDEADAIFPQVIGQAGGSDQILDIALMARAFADDDFGRAGPAHRDCRADNHRRMGIDRGAWLGTPRGWA